MFTNLLCLNRWKENNNELFIKEYISSLISMCGVASANGRCSKQIFILGLKVTENPRYSGRLGNGFLRR